TADGARTAPASDLFDLPVFEFDRRRPAEDGDADLHAALLLVHLLDRAVEARERAVGDAHLLADLEQHGRARALHAFLRLLHDPLGLGVADRRGAVAGAEE